MNRKITKKKKMNIFVILFYILLIIGLSIYTIKCSINKKEKDENKDIELIDPEPINETYSFSFIGLGDNLIHPYVYMDADTHVKENGYNKYDFTKDYQYLKEIAKDYDLKYYNQESIIGGKNLGLSGFPQFNSPDEAAEGMIDAGFNLVSLATNHSYDKGEKAINYSVNFWKNKAANNTLAFAGTYLSQEERDEVHIYTINGITFAYFNYTDSTNGISVPNLYYVNYWNNENYKNKVKEDIDKVRDKVDVVMVAMHWGTEYQIGKYNNSQLNMATYLSSLGVDVIIGTHAHVVQPVEYVNDTLVFYSLGNMLSNQRDAANLSGTYAGVGAGMVGGVAGFDVIKTVQGSETKVEIVNPRVDLVYTYSNGHSNYQVIPFSRLNNSLLNNYQNVYATYTKYLNPKGDSRIQIGFIN